MPFHDPRHAALAHRCAALGFDLVQPFAVAAYNRTVPAAYRLPTYSRRDALGLLIAHTRALWAPFLAACRRDAALRADPHPLDRYTETRLAALLRELGLRGAVRGSHFRLPRRLAIQRLAALSGLAAVAPAGINVHPVHGPWIGLRAAIALDAVAPAAMLAAPARLACDACPQACLPAFARARATPDGPDAWRAWLAVRDACPLGRAARYDDAQVRYHYTKDPTLFRGGAN